MVFACTIWCHVPTRNGTRHARNTGFQAGGGHETSGQYGPGNVRQWLVTTHVSLPGRKPPMPALSERDMRVLAFERRTWRTVGAKEQEIADALGMPATRYYQLLNELIDRPEALQFDPSLVKRLRAQRARRGALRAAGSKQVS